MQYRQAMLTEINAAVVAGEIPVNAATREHIQRCADRIVDGDETAWGDFAKYLREHQTELRLVGRHLVGVGYRFLDEELERLHQIKAERPFNQQERDYGLHVLTQLLNEITALACKTGIPDSE
jgi:hypothetical protein